MILDVLQRQGAAHRGAYDGGTTYYLGDRSLDQDSTWEYINVLPGSGNAPPTLPDTENSHWRLVALHGGQGIPGPSGASNFTIVRLVAAANIDLAADLEAGDTLDGVVLAENDLVLVAGQTAPEENGVYLVPASGAASRHSDFDDYNDHPGKLFSVMEGSANENTKWNCTSDRGGTIDVTGLVFAKEVAGGDMAKATYDPGNVNDNAFAMDNMVEGSTTKIMTDTERTKLGGVSPGADVTEDVIDGASAKATPVDADTMPLTDSADSQTIKKITFANIWAWIMSKVAGLAAKAAPVAGDGLYLVDSAASNVGKLLSWANLLALMDARIEVAEGNEQTGTSYTAALTDRGGIVEMNNGSANTFNIPTNATVNFDRWAVMNVVQTGAGVTTIQAPAGVLLNGVDGGGCDIGEQFGGASLYQSATDEWIVSGNIGEVA